MNVKKEHDSDKKYHEYIAKLVLEYCFPYEFIDLHQGEKPDLRIDNSKGVEVTRVMSTSEGEMSFLFKLVEKKKEEDSNTKILRDIRKLGYNLLVHPSTGEFCGYGPTEARWEDYKDVQRVFSEKLDKLEHYTEHTDLFIFSPSAGWYEENEIKEIHEFMIQQQTEKDKKFECAYIFDYRSLYKCDLERKTISRVIIDDIVIRDIIECAFEKYYTRI